MHPVDRIRLAITGILAVVLALAAMGAFLAAFAVPALQILGWLNSGEWRSVSIIDGLIFARDLMADSEAELTNAGHWLVTPNSWIGLHKLLSFLHVSVALWTASAIAVCFVSEFDWSERKFSKRTVRPRKHRRESKATPE